MADKNKRNKRYQLPKNRIVIPLIIYILVFMFASAVISLSGDLIATYATKIKALTEVENTAKLAKLYNDAPADGLDMVFDDINKSGYKVFVTDSKLNVIRNDESTGASGDAVCDRQQGESATALPFLVGLWDQKLCILIRNMIK